jgi:hypothetical protein
LPPDNGLDSRQYNDRRSKTPNSLRWQCVNRNRFLLLGPDKSARIGSRNCDRMRNQRFKSPEEGLRIVVESDLMQDAPPVVVNSFTGELSLFIEREEPAERKRHSSPGGWKTTPGPKVVYR